MDRYLQIPFKIVGEDGKQHTRCFFISRAFIEEGVDWSISPDNLFGVNLKALLKDLESSETANEDQGE